MSSAYQSFFLQPVDTWHRRYEAVRAVMVEEQPLADVARRFGVSYGTACNWVSQFRSQCDAGQRPPFFFPPCEDDRQNVPQAPTMPVTMSLPWPMCGSCR